SRSTRSPSASRKPPSRTPGPPLRAGPTLIHEEHAHGSFGQWQDAGGPPPADAEADQGVPAEPAQPVPAGDRDLDPGPGVRVPRPAGQEAELPPAVDRADQRRLSDAGDALQRVHPRP